MVLSPPRHDASHPPLGTGPSYKTLLASRQRLWLQPARRWLAVDARDARCSPGPLGTSRAGALVSPPRSQKRTEAETGAELSHSHRHLPAALVLDNSSSAKDSGCCRPEPKESSVSFDARASFTPRRKRTGEACTQYALSHTKRLHSKPFHPS